MATRYKRFQRWGHSTFWLDPKTHEAYYLSDRPGRKWVVSHSSVLGRSAPEESEPLPYRAALTEMHRRISEADEKEEDDAPN